MLDNHTMGSLGLIEHSWAKVRWWPSNQISIFRIGTHLSFLTYWQLTFMLHYRIHGFLRHEIFNLGSCFIKVHFLFESNENTASFC